MRDAQRHIPKKFSNANKSFLNRLFEEENHGLLSSFSVFPKKLNFYGKDPGEEVILVVRTHWIAYIPNTVFALLCIFLPIILLFFPKLLNSLGSSTLYIGILIVCTLLCINILVTTVLKWFFTVNIVTDQRIVVVRMDNAFYHSYAEAQLEKIEDITHKTIGFWGNMLDVGDVDIDTAGHEVDFHLRTIPRPRELQDVINDLLEMKQKGDI